MAALSSSTYSRLNGQLYVLGNEDVLYEKTSIIGVQAVLRAPSIELGQAVSNISKLGDTSKITKVEIYADSIRADGKVVLPSSCTTMVIFAREAFLDGNPVEIQFFSVGLQVLVYTSASDVRTIPVRITSKTTANEYMISVPADGAGGKVVVRDNGTATYATLSPSEAHFNVLSLTDQILDNGELNAAGFDLANDNLRRLLDYQLLLAATLQDSNPSAAISLASFVLRQTQGITEALDIYSQASAIATVQVISSNDSHVAHIPSIDLSAAQQVLQSRLQSALSFETAFENYSMQKDTAENIMTFASVALQASQDTDRTYGAIAIVNKARYENAVRALGSAQKSFQDLQMTMVAKRDAFRDGVEKWKNKEIGKVCGEAIIGVAMVVGSIAVAVVFPPAAAGAVAGAGAAIPAVGAAAANIAQTVSLIDRIIKILKELFEKLKPGLEKIDKLVTALQHTLELLSKMKSVEGVDAKVSMPSLQLGDDQINISADWDAFGTQMQYLYEPLKEYNIDGASDYFLMLAEMVIRAKAVLAAQTAVAVTGDAFIVTTTQQLASQRQTQRLEKALGQIQGNPLAFRIFKLSMLDRLMSVRAWIALDFKSYVAALEWYSLQKINVIRIDPLKKIQEFVNDAALLQAEVAQRSSAIRAQKKLFRLDTRDVSSPLIIGSNWLEKLQSQRTLDFNIDVTSSMFAQIGRVRLLNFRLYLTGVGGSNAVGMTARLSSDIFDLSLGPIGSTTSELNASSRAVAYLMTEQAIRFEYLSGTGEILVEGGLDHLKSGPLSSPFREWHVTIDPGTEVAGVTSMRLELTCEFSLVA
ncbi:hypothetical protein G7054_g6312 [Neopestalotiopsis clavispora]|nr:hypothetical protein G7054_g6312 [Neopestalotiopsis clavispora]